jgi:hypothetical protein
MTEAEWLACRAPVAMLDDGRTTLSQRKFRLLACAACYRCWSLLTPIAQQSLQVVERYADGLAAEGELTKAQGRALEGQMSAEDEAVYFAAEADAWMGAREAVVAAAGKELIFGWPGRNEYNAEAQETELGIASDTVRDIFGNPFRPVAFSPEWRTNTAVALARQMYESRDFSAMPILADALQDAGCNSEEVLSHCRDANAAHVRGCWVVDLVLGKQ